MSAFNWKTEPLLADGQQYAEWRGLFLWANDLGEWSVVRLATIYERSTTLITHDDQTKGKDINEAKQRAQAAAIVQLQLTGVNNE